jgi:hypothetical protein
MSDSSKKKRVKLNLDDLVVESFDTLPGALGPEKGTVRAFETDTCQLITYPCYSGCQTVCGQETCVGSCGNTCGGCDPTQTCGVTANTCGCESGQFTCTPACQSAWTYASCGGSCEETDCPGQGNCTTVFPYCDQV